jgi:glycosyltransferase XagB
MSHGQADRLPSAAQRRISWPALPAEIGFLAHYGIEPGILQEAATLAILIGSSADRVLLTSGAIGQDEFYRALAQELGLPFVASPRLSDRADYPNSILAGIAPLAHPGAGYVAAPEGDQIPRLLRPGAPRHPLAITTPANLTKAVIAARAASIAREASNRLPETRPDLSIRDGSLNTQIAVYCGLSFGLSFMLNAHFALGLMALATLLSPLFFGIVVIRLASALLGNPTAPLQPVAIEDGSLPVYTIIAALYREKRVVSRLVSALTLLDYPAAKLDIKFVIEADDPQTLEALSACNLPGFMEIIVAPRGEPRTKPRALNVALPLARGDLIVLYDAEDVPDAEQLRLAAGAFGRLPSDVACLQARLTIENTHDSILTRLFTIDVKKHALTRQRSEVSLPPAADHCRKRRLIA